MKYDPWINLEEVGYPDDSRTVWLTVNYHDKPVLGFMSQVRDEIHMCLGRSVEDLKDCVRLGGVYRCTCWAELVPPEIPDTDYRGYVPRSEVPVPSGVIRKHEDGSLNHYYHEYTPISVGENTK